MKPLQAQLLYTLFVVKSRIYLTRIDSLFNSSSWPYTASMNPIPLKDNRALANKKRPHGGVAPHGLVIFRFTCEDQSQAQRLIQLSSWIMT